MVLNCIFAHTQYNHSHSIHKYNASWTHDSPQEVISCVSCMTFFTVYILMSYAYAITLHPSDFHTQKVLSYSFIGTAGTVLIWMCMCTQAVMFD